MDLFKEKIAVDLKLICSTCGKPVAGKPRSNVTRFLFRESRCNCRTPELREQAAAQLPLNQNDNAQTIERLDDAKRKDIEDVLGNRYELLSFLGQGGMSS